uniref:Uncharacterized protein n=1 Tax=Paramoeba aestuarina TaxID=180227 RepID=A0A7S4PDD2_9EUKA
MYALFFAMFLDDCGLLAQAESQFLSTLEKCPHFAFGLVQYAQFLVKRGSMASATAMLKRVKDLRTKVVHPLTGKEILKIFRVYFSDGTFTAVEMNALSTASEMTEHVVRVMKVKAEKSNTVEITDRKLKILSLHYIDEGDQGRSRPMKNEESPWLLRLSGMKGEKGSKRVFFLPLKTPVEADVSLYEHYRRQVVALELAPAFLLTNPPDFGPDKKEFGVLFSQTMREESKNKAAKRITQEINMGCIAIEIFLLSVGLYRVVQHDCNLDCTDIPSLLLQPPPATPPPFTKSLLLAHAVEKEFEYFDKISPFLQKTGGKGMKKGEEKLLNEWIKRLFVVSFWVLEKILRNQKTLKSFDYFDFGWQLNVLVGGVLALGSELGSKQVDAKLVAKLGTAYQKIQKKDH